MKKISVKTRLKLMLAASTGALSVALSRATFAATPAGDEVAKVERFGERGQFVLPDILSYSYPGGFRHTFSITHGRSEGPQQHGDNSGVFLTPSADIFLGRRVSVGAELVAVYVTMSSDYADPAIADTPRWHQFSTLLIPRVGYAVPLSSAITLWSRLGVGYGTMFVAPDNTPYAGGFRHNVTVSADAAFLFHLGRYVFLSAGPMARTSVNWGDANGNAVDQRAVFVDVGGRTGLGLVFGR